MDTWKIGRRAALALALAGTLAASGACGSGGGSAEEDLTQVTYRGPFVTTGGDAPFYYAEKLGYYAEEGLEVEIRDSKGSSQTIADVNSGGSDFGMASATNLMLAVSQGQQVTSVATPLGKSSFGFFVPKDSGITEVSELTGRSIAVTALVAPNMYAALSTAGLQKDRVEPIFADATALPTTYLSGKVDAMYTAAYVAPAVRRRPSTLLLQSDAGYNPPDYALVIKKDLLAQRPETVRGFVRATLRGFQAAKKDPQAAVDALIAKHPELAPADALASLKSTFDYQCSAAQRGRPYGENSAADWSGAAAALQQFADLRGGTEGERFFTNELFSADGGIAVGTC